MGIESSIDPAKENEHNKSRNVAYRQCNMENQGGSMLNFLKEQKIVVSFLLVNILK